MLLSREDDRVAREGKNDNNAPMKEGQMYNGWWQEIRAKTLANMNTTPSDHVNFEPDQPTCFLTLGGGGMYHLDYAHDHPSGRWPRSADATRVLSKSV